MGIYGPEVKCPCPHCYACDGEGCRLCADGIRCSKRGFSKCGANPETPWEPGLKITRRGSRTVDCKLDMAERAEDRRKEAMVVELTDSMWRELGFTAVKSRWSRNPAVGLVRSEIFQRPMMERSAKALARRGMLEEQTFSLRVSYSKYERVAHYKPTEAGWEAWVVHRGWRTFERQDDGSYELTAPDRTVVGQARKGQKGGWCLSWAGEPRAEQDTAKRLSDVLSRLLGR